MFSFLVIDLFYLPNLASTFPLPYISLTFAEKIETKIEI